MNKQNMATVPDKNRIEDLLTKIQPVPSGNFHKKMEQVHWRIEQVQPREIKNKSRLKLTVAMFVLLIITTFTVTPQGRAWAQEVMQFFRKINSATVQLSDEQTKQMYEINTQYDLPLVPVFVPTVSPEMAAIAGCETPQKSQSYRCQIALAESKLGFDLKELPEKPIDWEFKSIYFNIDLDIAVISYDLDVKRTDYTSASSLVLTQGISSTLNSSNLYGNNPWDAVPVDKVEPISIGTHKGEYIKGRFYGVPDTNMLRWSDEFKEQRLAWSEGTRWYMIAFWPNPNVADTMGRDQLIHLAESLVTSPIETTEPVNPDHLTSISDAEKISGLDLKTPTLLPLDIDFSYARYFPDEQLVRFIYGPNESLTIDAWEGGPVDYKKPLGKYEFTCNIVNMNGNDAFYCFFEGTNPRSFLWWHSNGINYQMYYDSFSRWQIDREKMLLIAESMQDIDDFPKKNGRTYEQVVIYEQALGIDAKKFSNVPAGWVYANFWGDPYSQCIGLIYTSTTRQSTLVIDQCKTDKRFDVSVFPFWSTKRVKLGDAKGYYIVGDFVLADDGKQVWNPTSPRKQLYWQEDGLWIQISLYGEEALLSDKEDLISFAESLK